MRVDYWNCSFESWLLTNDALIRRGLSERGFGELNWSDDEIKTVIPYLSGERV